VHVIQGRIGMVWGIVGGLTGLISSSHGFLEQERSELALVCEDLLPHFKSSASTSNRKAYTQLIY
jgi:hypothetical protein